MDTQSTDNTFDRLWADWNAKEVPGLNTDALRTICRHWFGRGAHGVRDAQGTNQRVLAARVTDGKGIAPVVESTNAGYAMNQVDQWADRLVEISMNTEGPGGDILQRYAERLTNLSAETSRAPRKVEPVVFPLEHPPLRSLTEADEESLSRR